MDTLRKEIYTPGHEKSLSTDEMYTGAQEGLGKPGPGESETQLIFPAHFPPCRGQASQILHPSRLTMLFPAEPARNNTGSGFIFTPSFVIYHYGKTKRQALAEYPMEYSRSPGRIWPSLCRTYLIWSGLRLPANAPH